MFGIETLSGSTQAAATVGLVLAEAVLLYVGYGALSSTVASRVIEAVGGE